MKILAVETSCDDTSVAILACNEKNNQLQLLASVISSQTKVHKKWGGVVPNLAAREHLKNIIPVLNKALLQSNQKLRDIDLIAVTKGPGLIPALLIGTNAAKTLSYTCQIPLIGIHHVEGHIYANILKNNADTLLFPVLALTVSGGHTQLILMKNHLNYEIIGQTQDDAVGEAFDKVAKMLDLGYPGGPIVSKFANDFELEKKKLSNQKLLSRLNSIYFPRPMIMSSDFNFSFSGLKTSVLYFIQKLQAEKVEGKISNLEKMAICKAFETAAITVLVEKTTKAIAELSPKTVVLAGGVSANSRLQKTFESKVMEEFPTVKFLKPALEFCGDNAAMIGAAAFVRYQKLKKLEQLKPLKTEWKNLEANSNLKLESY